MRAIANIITSLCKLSFDIITIDVTFARSLIYFTGKNFKCSSFTCSIDSKQSKTLTICNTERDLIYSNFDTIFRRSEHFTEFINSDYIIGRLRIIYYVYFFLNILVISLRSIGNWAFLRHQRGETTHMRAIFNNKN